MGAAPGGWTYVLAERRARVIAIDPAKLRPDILAKKGVRHVQESAFTFTPDESIDWLFCDMAWRPLEAAALLAKWGRKRWARIVVANIKLPMTKKAEIWARVRQDPGERGRVEARARQAALPRPRRDHADRPANLTSRPRTVAAPTDRDPALFDAAERARTWGAAPVNLVTLLGLLLGCAHAHTASPAAGAPLGERVIAVLAHHHITPPAEAASCAHGCARGSGSRSAAHVRARRTPRPSKPTSCVHSTPMISAWSPRLRCHAASRFHFRHAGPTSLLDALAQAYDPHSRYLDAGALTRFRAQPHAPLGPGARLRAELVTHRITASACSRCPACICTPSTAPTALDLRDALHQLQKRKGPK